MYVQIYGNRQAYLLFTKKMTHYRPVSLLSTIGKVMEKIIHKYIFNFFNDNQVITCLQSGFVPGDSTVNQLVDIYNIFCKGIR